MALNSLVQGILRIPMMTREEKSGNAKKSRFMKPNGFQIIAHHTPCCIGSLWHRLAYQGLTRQVSYTDIGGTKK